MRRAQLEKHQVWLYLLAVGAGVTVGIRAGPAIADAIIYLPLGVLLYATFTQVPVAQLPEAVRDRRYLAAALMANFVLVPATVWVLAWLVPPEPAILLGFYMVLLLPCTDWFMVFAHLGRGDAKRAIASTPVMLVAQLLLLPLYLWLFMGQTFAEVIRAGPVVQVFALLIVLPLLAATLTQAWATHRPAGQRAIAAMAWLPVPCLALVLLLVTASQAGQVIDELPGMERVVVAFVLYLVAAAGIGIVTARWFALPVPAGRTLIFSVGTRNSFVVLPFVLALPAGWEMAVTVVVLQPLVELLGMLVYLRLVPRCGEHRRPRSNARL